MAFIGDALADQIDGIRESSVLSCNRQGRIEQHLLLSHLALAIVRRCSDYVEDRLLPVLVFSHLESPGIVRSIVGIDEQLKCFLFIGHCIRSGASSELRHEIPTAWHSVLVVGMKIYPGCLWAPSRPTWRCTVDLRN